MDVLFHRSGVHARLRSGGGADDEAGVYTFASAGCHSDLGAQRGRVRCWVGLAS